MDGTASILNFTADVASIIALIGTILNALQINNVKRNVVLNLTLGDSWDRLKTYSLQLNQFLITFEPCIDDFDEVVGLCEADVLAIRRRFGYRRGRFCRVLLGAIAAYKKTKSADTARSVYNELQQLAQEIANRIDERRIMGP